MRTSKKYPLNLTEKFKQKLLLWAQQYSEIVWLDTNNHNQKHQKYQAVLAIDAFTSIKTDFHSSFEQLDEYQKLTNDWIFGYFTYDLKNDTEKLSSSNFDGLGFPDLYFFQPKKLFLISENDIELRYLNMVDDELESDWQEIENMVYQQTDNNSSKIKIHLRTSKDTYFEKVNKMLQHIHRGDIYEANYCQEFFSENTELDPLKTYLQLNEISQPPFATFLKLEDHYAISASPERYLKKEGTTVITQPIKGTAKREVNEEKDNERIEALRSDPKERSENIMITDLVRNDLSKFAEKGSVRVEELCEVYSFKQVHQMISTIVCKVSEETSPVSIIKKTFPMGSMTGAPKISAMKIIEDLEDAKRGLYSGSIGYFEPNGDFDFNVIIRSILYNAASNYVSYSVGGAITAKSIPENEYEECLIKAKAMREVLEG